MKHIKRYISILLAVVLLVFTTMLPCYAAEDGELIYAIDTVVSWLNKESYIAESNVYLSNAVPLYNYDANNTERGNLYFVFEGNENIGTLLTYMVDDQLASTFYFSDYSEIELAWRNHKDVVLLQTNGAFLLYIDSNLVILDNPESRELNLSEIKGNLGNVTSTTLAGSNLLNIFPSGRSVYYYLDVTRVANTSIGGAGQCWAACLAAKINHQKGTNLKASDVYYTCWDTVDRDEKNVPCGVDSWYRVGATQYGITLTILSGPASKTTIASVLSQEKPIIIGVTDETSSKSATYAHALLLCGIDEDADYYELIFMDPNVSSKVYLDLPHSVLTNRYSFYYATTSYTYTCWSKTRY